MTIIILLIYVLLPAGFSLMYLSGYIYSFTEFFEPYNISILAGAAAYVVFMSQFFLSARLRFLERRVPQDKLLALHGSAGAASLALVLIHFLIKFFMVVIPSGISFQTAMGTVALLALIILSPMAYLVLRGKAVKKDTSPPYAGVKKGHNIFALAGLAAVIHVMFASSTWSVALKIFTLVWGVLALTAYLYHKILRPGRRSELILAAISRLAPDVHEYSFDGRVARSSGQFGYFSFESENTGVEEHPFTIAASAGEQLKITVRGSGDFSSSMPELPVGTIVRFDGPYGQFSPNRFSEGTPLIFLAAGIGITPVLSLVLDQGIRSSYPITVIWSIHVDEDRQIAPDLQALADAGELGLKIRVSSLEGRIAEEFIEHENSAAYFICGPGGFGKSMRMLLKNRGIKRRFIIEERFSW
ncbi:MAG: hypothetical protein PQJ61_01750 [Spirochaetales bacterium]|uniref:FAD-binding FR-type domain-containing protein n=1 Tax=Candidatus Thalassospirochaeta sargassi TaxID=3119039 RepID=A0AAJ1MMH7_9SPIO|nr:hypothetical protein [Spirochaetales bacterium]